MVTQKVTVEYEEFGELGFDDLKLYRKLSEALRGFELTVMYNFFSSEEHRRGLTDGITGAIRAAYGELGKLYPGGKLDCPFCPDPDDCANCPPLRRMKVAIQS